MTDIATVRRQSTRTVRCTLNDTLVTTLSLTSRRSVLCSFVATVLAVGCSDVAERSDVTEPASRKPLVVTTGFAVCEVAEMLSGPDVEVRLVATNAADGETSQPSSADITLMQEADLVLLTGCGWEPWTSVVSLPQSRVIDVSSGLSEHLIFLDEAVTHRHGPDGEVESGRVAWGAWLSPRLLNLQSDSVASALRRVGLAVDEDAHRQLQEKLALMHGELQKIGDEVPKGFPVKLTEPGFRYLFAELRNCRLVTESSDDTLVVVSNESRRHNLKHDGQVCVLDRCLREQPESDLLERLRDNIAQLQNAIRGAVARD